MRKRLVGVTLIALIVLAVLFLSYSNGGNDNFKGVATLFGSGVSNYRRALIWAAITTLAGSLAALLLAGQLVERFQGKGLVEEAITLQPAFVLAVSIGAALTVLLATMTGLPVSTTHALLGGLVGAGLVATGGMVNFAVLGNEFVLPLVLSPILALTLTAMIYPVFRVARHACGVTRRTCVCIGTVYQEVAPQPDGSLALVRPAASLQVWAASECVERYEGRILGLRAGPLLDLLHYLSAGAVGFARGLNDTPKIVALLLIAGAINPQLGLGLVALAMAAGGVLNARRVAETMSRRITRMNPGQGFTANLVTSLLVATAAGFGLPVSTTHVSVGSLFGIGVVNHTARIKTITSILLAWVTTLPLAAVLAAGSYWAFRSLGVGE